MTEKQDWLLGGRVRHAQPSTGHRTGIEPVLLAACIPARPGEHVLEAGTGAGAALLCLAARIPGLTGLGIERNPNQADLARANLAANALTGFDILTADLDTAPLAGSFDHAFANPPWHDPHSTASPNAAQDDARRARPGLLALWTSRLAAPLRHRGTLSLILPAARLSESLAALTEAKCGSHGILPLWPRAGRPAKLVLVQAIRLGRGPTRLLPGLVLHRPEGGYTDEADSILRHAAPLPMQRG